MKRLIQIDSQSKEPKYLQIVREVINAIERGRLAHGQQLPSIGELSEWQQVAKVTVAKAYEALRQRGIVHARHGKGFYVASTEVKSQLNVFVLFDTLNAYKETLYFAMKASLPENARLRLFFHHYDRQQFESLLLSSLGDYNYYVVMPHFNEDISGVINRIPREKLILIDKLPEGVTGDFSAVYQDFDHDIYEALVSGKDLLSKYKKLTLLLSADHFQFIPDGLISGFNRFGSAHGITCVIAEKLDECVVSEGEAFLIFYDRDLIAFIKNVHLQGLKLGKDIGLISYDDTPMKEILEGGITVISTDFERMGKTIGRMLTEGLKEKIANPAGLIRRHTL